MPATAGICINDFAYARSACREVRQRWVHASFEIQCSCQHPGRKADEYKHPECLIIDQSVRRDQQCLDRLESEILYRWFPADSAAQQKTLAVGPVYRIWDMHDYIYLSCLYVVQDKIINSSYVKVYLGTRSQLLIKKWQEVQTWLSAWPAVSMRSHILATKHLRSLSNKKREHRSARVSWRASLMISLSNTSTLSNHTLGKRRRNKKKTA